MHHHLVVVDFIAVLFAVENIVDFELHAQAVVVQCLDGVEVDRPHVATEMHIAVVARTLIVGSEEE